MKPCGNGGETCHSCCRRDRQALRRVLAVDNVDFMLRGDEAVGIVGPNGAGKTTLLNLLAGAYRRRWYCEFSAA